MRDVLDVATVSEHEVSETRSMWIGRAIQDDRDIIDIRDNHQRCLDAACWELRKDELGRYLHRGEAPQVALTNRFWPPQ